MPSCAKEYRFSDYSLYTPTVRNYSNFIARLFLATVAITSFCCNNFSTAPIVVTEPFMPIEYLPGSIQVAFLQSSSMKASDTVVAELMPGNYRWKGYIYQLCTFKNIPPGVYTFRASCANQTSNTMLLFHSSSTEQGKSYVVGFHSSEGNRAPQAAYNPIPNDGELFTVDKKSIHFHWQCSDPDGDALRYTVYVSSRKDFLHYYSIATEQRQTTHTMSPLPSASALYWFVLASDSLENKSISPVWMITLPKRDPELLLHMPCNSSITDISPEHHNTAGYNISYVADRHGAPNQAILIDSSFSSHIDINNSPSMPFHPGEDFSLCFWIQISNKRDTYHQPIPMLGCYVQRNRFIKATGWQLSLAGANTLSMSYNNNSYSNKLTMLGGIDNNEWRHVVFVFHALERRCEMYVDGKLASNNHVPISELLMFTNTPFIIGNTVSQTRDYLRAAYDDIRLYSGIISKEQIQALATE